MQPDGITISLSLPYGLGTVNCYLITTGKGFILIDTGCANQRHSLDGELARAGCKTGDLQLVVITHGDFDHIGNAAHLRATYQVKIAMHADDAGMAEFGNMFWNRKKGNPLIKLLAPALFRFNKADRFTPDLVLSEGADLQEYGFGAKVLSIPGHSRGSIGILSAEGDLFCGDLLTNIDHPVLNAIMDDETQAQASVEKLKSLPVKMVYPGHGQPFSMESFLEKRFVPGAHDGNH